MRGWYSTGRGSYTAHTYTKGAPEMVLSAERAHGRKWFWAMQDWQHRQLAYGIEDTLADAQKRAEKAYAKYASLYTAGPMLRLIRGGRV